jgi:hypothetical protein
VSITDYIYVHDAAPGGDPGNLVPLVRAANGKGVTRPGFDFMANYTKWCDHFNAHLPAWTYMYPGDSGTAVGDALLKAAPFAPFYVIDAEDPTIKTADLKLAYAVLRRRAPVWLSTYGEVSQAKSHGVQIDGTHWDVATPQMYYGYQTSAATESAWHAYANQIVPSVSPPDYSGWKNIALRGPVVVWEWTTVNPRKVSDALATLPGRVNNPVARKPPPGTQGPCC